ncbi:MAG: hypothetical protein ACT4TC_09615 [Myxococcaceae bacterium]
MRERVQLQYERVLDACTAYVLTPSFAFWNNAYSTDLQVEQSVKLYLSGEAPHGFFLAPLVSFGIEVGRERAPGTNVSFAAGAAFGYSMKLWEGLTATASLGATYRTYLVRGSDSYDSTGLVPVARLGVGWAF